MSRTSRFAVALGAAALLALTACSGGASSDESGDDAGIGPITEGKLTVATGEPAYAPWVLNDDPESAEGFEAAVTYAVAEEMGFAPEDVVWVRTSFDSAIAPGPKDFDINIQQFSVSPERANAVDFSTPYYETTQAVVAAGGTAAADATSLDELKDTKIGVASGTTSLQVTEEVLGVTPEVFNSLDDAVAALTSGTIDAIVTDLPGAFYVRDAQLDDGVIVGQLESEAGGDEFAFVLPKGSSLTASVSEAVDAIRDNGTLDELTAEWIADQGAPVLQ